MTARAPYIAVIAPVREVILAGAADLAFWRERLRPEGLRPAEEDGRAALLITTMASKFNGIPFREFTISMPVMGEGAFLVYAYNSSRLLGFAERRLFRTPYFHAAIEVRERPPAQVRVSRGGKTAFAARLGDGAAGTSRDERFEGPIYLPGDGHGPGEMFQARLEGRVDAYPFDATRDTLAIDPTAAPVFELLVASGFAAQEWRLRGDAVHSRTRTYPRPTAR